MSPSLSDGTGIGPLSQVCFKQYWKSMVKKKYVVEDVNEKPYVGRRTEVIAVGAQIIVLLDTRV